MVRADPAARVNREEVFGPFVTVTTFSGEDQALELANSVDYGLGGGLWTRDLSRAHRVARAIRSGMVWINSYKRVSPGSPFGGVGDSGYGREMGFEAMRGYTDPSRSGSTSTPTCRLVPALMRGPPPSFAYDALVAGGVRRRRGRAPGREVTGWAAGGCWPSPASGPSTAWWSGSAPLGGPSPTSSSTSRWRRPPGRWPRPPRPGDCLVAMGGGSATGMAKAVALEHPAPIVAVPTTYAGSEVTPIYGLTGPEGKRTGRDPRVLPRTVIYDPALTTGLPAEVTGPSGMNALAHSVEALYAPGANPLTSVLAEEGARVLARGLPRAVANPADLAARSDALLGAWLAGSAMAAAGVGIHHQLCHLLGGAYRCPRRAARRRPPPRRPLRRPAAPPAGQAGRSLGTRTSPAGSGTWAASSARRPAWPSSAWPRPSSTAPPPRPWPGSSRRRAGPG